MTDTMENSRLNRAHQNPGGLNVGNKFKYVTLKAPPRWDKTPYENRGSVKRRVFFQGPDARN